MGTGEDKVKEAHKSKNETWRLRYLRILTGPAADAGNSQEDLQAIEDLVDEKLIRGSTMPNEQGEVRAAALITGSDGLVVPTLKGRLFIEEQRAYLRSRTFLARLKANWPLFSGMIGIIVGWSLSLLTPLAQQREHAAVRDSKSAYGSPEQSQPGWKPTASPTPAEP